MALVGGFRQVQRPSLALLSSALFDALPYSLVVAYACSPVAYDAAFSSFACDEFPQTPPPNSADMAPPQPVEAYLVADYEVAW